MDKSVRITIRKQTYELKPGLTLLEALEQLGIEPESVLALRSGEMIPGESVLNEGDEVKLVRVISGGAGMRNA